MRETAEAIGISLAATKGRLFTKKRAPQVSDPKTGAPTSICQQIRALLTGQWSRERMHEHASTINSNPMKGRRR